MGSGLLRAENINLKLYDHVRDSRGAGREAYNVYSDAEGNVRCQCSPPDTFTQTIVSVLPILSLITSL